MDTFNLVLALENARSSESEIKILEKLCHFLSLDNDGPHVSDDRDMDTEWLKKASDEDVVNPFPSNTPQDILKGQENLNRFTFYLFERRYGWSEHLIHSDSNTGLLKEGPSHSTTGRSSSLEIESKFKGQINELLDDLLKWQVFGIYVPEKEDF